MEVILLEDIRKLGNLGDRIKVKAGYGRNYLIPVGKAVPASPENIKEFESRRAELEQAQKDTLGVTMDRAEKLNATEIILTRIAGEEGRLFGSVSVTDIVEAVTALGVELSKNEVRLPTKALRAVGEYEVNIHLSAEIDAQIQVNIVAKQD